MDKGVQSVTVFVRLPLATFDASLKVRICEPDKCFEWRWASPAAPLPQPMFPPLEHLVASTWWRDEIAPRTVLGDLRRLARDLPLLLAGGVLGAAAVAAVSSARRLKKI